MAGIISRTYKRSPLYKGLKRYWKKNEKGTKRSIKRFFKSTEKGMSKGAEEGATNRTFRNIARRELPAAQSIGSMTYRNSFDQPSSADMGNASQPATESMDSYVEAANVQADAKVTEAEIEQDTRLELQKRLFKHERTMESVGKSKKGLYRATRDAILGSDAKEVMDEIKNLERPRVTTKPVPFSKLPRWKQNWKRKNYYR